MRVVADVDPALLLRRRELMRAQGRRRLALLVGAALLVAAAGGYYALRASSAFAVRTVEVTGAGDGVAADVRAAVEPRVAGVNLLALDAGSVEQAVERLPAVRSAAVDRAFPHALRVSVELWQPAAAVRVGSGKHAERFLIAADGHVLAAPARPRRNLPHVELPGGSTLVVGSRSGDANVRSALTVMRETARFGDLGRLRRIVPRAGTVVALVGHRLQLRLGEAEGIDLKLRVAARVMRRIGTQQRQTIAYLDVSVPARPALGLRSNA
jgi:cell division septal protein FtsQ